MSSIWPCCTRWAGGAWPRTDKTSSGWIRTPRTTWFPILSPRGPYLLPFILDTSPWFSDPCCIYHFNNSLDQFGEMLSGWAIRPGRQGGGSLWAWDGAFGRYRGLSTPFTDGRGAEKPPGLPPHTAILLAPVSKGLLSWSQLSALVTRELRQVT